MRESTEFSEEMQAWLLERAECEIDVDRGGCFLGSIYKPLFVFEFQKQEEKTGKYLLFNSIKKHSEVSGAEFIKNIRINEGTTPYEVIVYLTNGDRVVLDKDMSVLVWNTFKQMWTMDKGKGEL